MHLGHREVIRGSDSVLTFDPHPVSVVAPQHTPKLLTTLERKAELIASLGVRGADRDPVRRRLRQALGGRVRRRRARRRAGRHAGGDRRELPLRAQGAGRSAPARRRRALSDRRAPAARGGRGDRLLEPHPGLVLAGEVRRGQPAAGRPLSAERRGRARRRARTRARLPDRQPRPRGGARVPRARRLRVPRRRAPGGGEHRRAPDLQDRQGRADRGLPARLRRRPLRQPAAPRVPRAPARRAALRHARGARRADAPRRGAHARARLGGC